MLDSINAPLNQKIICDVAIQINKNMDKISGYRTGAVYIRGAEHIPPDPQEVSQRMMYLVYNIDKTQYDSIFEKAADFHLQFEHIHPFSNGNGRTGRIMINYFLLKDEKLPIVIPKEERSRYFKYLENQDIKGLADYLKELNEKEKILAQQLKNQAVEKSQDLEL